MSTSRTTSRSSASTGSRRRSWTEPALTTVEQPIDEIAETAVRALVSLIAEPGLELPNYVFRPRLRLGGSTASLNGNARSTSRNDANGSNGTARSDR